MHKKTYPRRSRSNSTKSSVSYKIVEASKRITQLILTFRRLRIVVVLGAIALVSLSIYLFYVSVREGIWDIAVVEIQSDNLVYSKASISSLQAELLDQPIFTIDSEQYVDKYTSNAFISYLEIEKIFPNRLIIIVEESKPRNYIVDLNNVYLLDNNGDVLTQTSNEQSYLLSETERLVYRSDQTFKSDLLKQKWLTRVEAELKEEYQAQLDLFLEQQQSSTALEDSEELQETPSVSTESSATDEQVEVKEFMEFEQFVDTEFSNLELEELSQDYSLLKQEISVTVDQQWQELKANFNFDDSIPKIYSLINFTELADIENIINANKINLWEELYKKKLNYSVETKIIVNQNILLFKLTTPEIDQSLEILISMQKDTQQNFSLLENLLLKLKIEGEQFTRIDLVGEKIIIS